MNWIIEYYRQLEFRERLVLVIGGMSACAMLVWALGIDAAYQSASGNRKMVERKLSSAHELGLVLDEYRRLKARSAGGSAAQAKTPKGFSLLSFMEGLASQAQVKGNIRSMRPITSDVAEGVVEQAVELQLTNVRLEPVVEMLTEVERSPHALRIRRLNMKRRFSDPDLLEITFTVARYEEA
ncbi:MAG: type II secretion system protein M [Nitrospirota bacterium]|nr:type II secretion system protein M [Nitrospirota bacterium]